MHTLHFPLVPHPFLLLTVGLIVGIMNAIGGGGTFIAFPFLLFLGVPAIAANATATVATWPGTFAVMVAYRRELYSHKDKLLLVGIISLIGGGIGAVTLLVLSNDKFAQAVPYLLLFATCLFTFRIYITRRIQNIPDLETPQAALTKGTRFLLDGVLFLISIYSGFFGAGSGILLLAMLSMRGLVDIHKMNALRAFIGLSANTVAIVIFAVAGIVYWKETVLMGVGITSGGYLGAYFFRTLPAKWGQVIIIFIAWSITILMFLK